MQGSEDYYFDENGYVVFTEHYLSKRGFCCGNGCRHCPYDYENVANEVRLKELRAARSVEADSTYRTDSPNQ